MVLHFGEEIVIAWNHIMWVRWMFQNLPLLAAQEDYDSSGVSSCELIRAIGWAIRNINKDGRAYGVRRLPNIWQKVINKGVAILKVLTNCTSVNKAMSEISNCCHYFVANHCICSEAKGDWDFRISDLDKKTLMELIFNLIGEFRWIPEGPVNQIHSPHLHVGASGIFSDLLKPAQMLKREWGVESNGKLPHPFIPSKTATLVPVFAVEDLPLDRTVTLIPTFSVKDLPLGRTFWWWYCSLLIL